TCGGTNPPEPCIPPNNLPYYRPTSYVTRAQMSKFVDLARQSAGFSIYSTTNIAPFASGSSATAGAGVNGYTLGSGSGRTPDTLNVGEFGYAGGTTNSVGVLALSENDVAAWVTT